jgi:hypothetical protein
MLGRRAGLDMQEECVARRDDHSWAGGAIVPGIDAEQRQTEHHLAPNPDPLR